MRRRPRPPPDAIGKTPAVAVDAPAATGTSSPETRTVAPASGSDANTARLVPQDAAALRATATAEAVATSPNTVGNQSTGTGGGGLAMSVSSSDGGAGAPASGSYAKAAKATSQVEAPALDATATEQTAAIPPDAVRRGVAAVSDTGNSEAAATSIDTARPGRDIVLSAAAVSVLPVIARPDPIQKQIPVQSSGTPTVALDASSTASEPVARLTQSPLASDKVTREDSPSTGMVATDATSRTKVLAGSVDQALGKTDDAHETPSGDMVSIAMGKPPIAAASVSGSATPVLTIAIADVMTHPEGTTIAYTITNPATSLVDLLFVRCDAIDPKGTIVGSVFDYVENIPAGQQVKRVVRIPSDITSGQSFSCANDAATQQ